MSRRRMIVAGTAAALVVAIAGWMGARRLAGDRVPVVRVARMSLVRRVVADGVLRAKRSTPLTAPIEAHEGMKIASMVADGSRVEEGDVVLRFDPSELERRLADGRADRLAADAKVTKSNAQSGASLANLQRDADLSEAELEAARRYQSSDEEIYSRSEIIEAAIDTDLARARKEHAESVRDTSRRVSGAERELLEIERRKADLQVDEAVQGLSALSVTAPHAGTVVFQRNWRGTPPRVGDQVWPGQKLAEIPDLSTMEVETWVLEADAGGLAVGKRATVRLESHPEISYPATVRRVDTLAKPRRRGVPVQFFGATLELESTDPQVMRPGQRVTVTLILEEIEDVLVVPLQAVLERDEKKVVYRREGGRFEAVEVTLGAPSLGRAVVTAGLAEGEVVALRDPWRSAAELVAPQGGGERNGQAPALARSGS